MTDGFKEKVARVLTVTLLLLIGCGGAFAVWPIYQRERSLKKQDAELTVRIEAKKLEIQKLIDNQKRFQTDSDFVEMIARKNRRVYPGELVFIFED